MDKKYTTKMNKYYRNLRIKNALDIIFNGTMYAWGNMIDYTNKVKEDIRTGKLK